MTRDEAIRVAQHTSHAQGAAAALVDNLVALGVLKLNTTEDKDRVAAIERLDGCFIVAKSDSLYHEKAFVLGVEGAAEILDILTKSGFKITR